MGNSILKGMSAALLVTVITLLAGMFWTAMGLGGLTMSTLVDIGLIVSCVTAGYQAGKMSGQWVLGGVAALGYVLLSIVLLSLFLEVNGWGVIQIVAEGGLIGILAGAFGVGGGAGRNRPAGSWRSSGRFSTWGDPYNRDSYRRDPYEEWDSHVDDWDDRESRNYNSEDRNKKNESEYWETEKNPEDWKDLRNSDRVSRTGLDRPSQIKVTGAEETQWTEEVDSSRQRERASFQRPGKSSDEDEWEDWVREEKKSPSSSYRKAWWEEDVL